jgi:hypothetical protein
MEKSQEMDIFLMPKKSKKYLKYVLLIAIATEWYLIVQ